MVYFFILIGIVWRFSPLFRPEFGEWFTKVAIWVFFPISIISSFGEVESFSGEAVVFVVVFGLLIHFISFIAIYFMTKSVSPVLAGAEVLCGTFPNALLFPFPIILAIIEESALVYASIFVFIAMVIRNTFGVYLGVYYGPNNLEEGHDGKKQLINWKKVFLDTLKFPPFLALIIGFFLHNLYGPEAINSFPSIDVIKAIALYGSLLLIGFSFQNVDQLKPRNIFGKDILKVSVTRFIVAPIAGLVILLVMSVPRLMAVPLFLQAMAPPAVSNILYGHFFKLDVAKISQFITSLTLIALIILPFELGLLVMFFHL
ncbi:MAG: AEC family transporter [Candidatus Hodarchaeales archaeon]